MKCFICGCDLSHWDYVNEGMKPEDLSCDNEECILAIDPDVDLNAIDWE